MKPWTKHRIRTKSPTWSKQVLAAEETDDIRSLLDVIGGLPPDSKLTSLRKTLGELRGDGYRQIMVFTQYTDTMDFLRDELGKDADLRLMCFSGRGGEVSHGGHLASDRPGRCEAPLSAMARQIYCSAPTLRRRGSTSSSAAPSSTTTCRGTPCGWSSASGASTASGSNIRSSASSICTMRIP